MPIVAHDPSRGVVALEFWIHCAIICEHLLDRIALAMHPVDVAARMPAVVPSPKVIQSKAKLSSKFACGDVLGGDKLAAVLGGLALFEKAAQRPRPAAEPTSCLVDGAGDARLAQPVRARDARKPAADDGDARRARAGAVKPEFDAADVGIARP